jgi:hypothetical protein
MNRYRIPYVPNPEQAGTQAELLPYVQLQAKDATSAQLAAHRVTGCPVLDPVQMVGVA